MYFERIAANVAFAMIAHALVDGPLNRRLEILSYATLNENRSAIDFQRRFPIVNILEVGTRGSMRCR